jgi:predicted 3-demethylubiquinone-9 3-methyltransferase (glyoxalase superfamily)
MEKIATFLMFVGEQHGKAEEAIEFYVSLFKDSRIITMERYGPGKEETEGTVKQATFSLNGQTFMAIDGGLEHSFTFTPAMSLFVQCETEEKVDRLYEELSRGGAILMELAAYPFSDKFAWLEDRFGVSWQLNLATNPG